MEVEGYLGWISLSMPRAQCREKWMMRSEEEAMMRSEGARF